MEEHFSNEQVEVSQLPSIDDVDLIPLQKDYLTAKVLGAVVFWLILSGVFLSILFFNSQDYPPYFDYMGLGVLVLLVATRFTLIIAGFHRKKYALRERDIMYRTGLLWRSSTVIPFNRIQHAEVNQGPMERMFNLSMLRVFTAGGSSSDMAIPGIRPSEAHRIKEYILKKAAIDEEE